MMKNFSMKLAGLLFMAIIIAGCQRNEMEAEPPITEPETATLYVKMPEPTAEQTRLGFVDNGAGGIKVTWGAQDVITIYDPADGKRLGNFFLSTGAGTKEAVFTGKVSLKQHTNYIAVYPSVGEPLYNNIRRMSNGQTQSKDGDATSKLDLETFLDCKFLYSTQANLGNWLKFDYVHSIMTIDLTPPAGYDVAVDGEPRLLSIRNSIVPTYYADIVIESGTVWDGVIKLYASTPTSGPAPRDLIYTLTTDNGTVYQQKINTSKAHVAGIRYTATVDKMVKVTNTTAIFDLDIIGRQDAPKADIWIVTTKRETLNNFQDFDALGTALRTLANTGRRISLVLPTLKKLPDHAFVHLNDMYGNFNYTALGSVELKEATHVGKFAFQKCPNLTQFRAPKLVEVGEQAFNLTPLTEINLPSLETLGIRALANCNYIRRAIFPKLKLIKASAFIGCFALTDIYAPVAETLEEGCFEWCPVLRNLEISTTMGSMISSNQTNLFRNSDVTKVTLKTACGVVFKNKKWQPVPFGPELGPFENVVDTRPLAKVADYFYSDRTYSSTFDPGKTCIGLVFALQREAASYQIVPHAGGSATAYGTSGLVVSLDQLADTVWSVTDNNAVKSQGDNGLYNTQQLKERYLTGLTDFPGINWALAKPQVYSNGFTWFIPSDMQLRALAAGYTGYNIAFGGGAVAGAELNDWGTKEMPLKDHQVYVFQRSMFDKRLTELGGTPLSGLQLWSSTTTGNNSATVWSYSFTEWIAKQNVPKQSKMTFRAVTAF